MQNATYFGPVRCVGTFAIGEDIEKLLAGSRYYFIRTSGFPPVPGIIITIVYPSIPL